MLKRFGKRSLWNKNAVLKIYIFYPKHRKTILELTVMDLQLKVFIAGFPTALILIVMSSPSITEKLLGAESENSGATENKNKIVQKYLLLLALAKIFEQNEK